VSEEPWVRRTAVLRAILREGGTIYRKQLNNDQEAHVPWLLSNDCVKAQDGKLTITATGRRMAKGAP
jgi:hypothetical protein